MSLKEAKSTDAGTYYVRITGPYGTFSGPGVSGTIFTPADAGSGGNVVYTVTTNSCTNSSSQSVTVSPAPRASAGPDKSVVFGYGSNCTELTATARGGSTPYTYEWSPGGLNQTVQACPRETTTYAVVATDINGCASSPAKVAVTVIDVRSGNNGDKILVCHKGNTLSLSANAVAAHLAHGDQLGSCGGSPAARLSAEESNVPLQLSVKVYPNPVHDAVTVEVLSPTTGKATFEVLDLQGRARQTRSEILSEGLNELEFRLGTLPTGIYLIRVRDGGSHHAAVRVSKE